MPTKSMNATVTLPLVRTMTMQKILLLVEILSLVKLKIPSLKPSIRLSADVLLVQKYEVYVKPEGSHFYVLSPC